VVEGSKSNSDVISTSRQAREKHAPPQAAVMIHESRKVPLSPRGGLLGMTVQE